MTVQSQAACLACTASALERVLAYEHPEMIERLKRKLKVDPQSALELFTDVKKYLYLVATSGQKLAPPPDIDAGWHEFLMYTRDYADFCRTHFDSFVHHAPDPVLRPRLVLNVVDTVNAASAAFGPLSRNWRVENSTECSPDSDCHGDGSCGGDV